MTASSTPISSYQDLVNLLTHDGVAFTAEPQVQTVRVATQMRGIEGEQLIRFQDADGVMQFIQWMPITNIPLGAMPAMESAVSRLNHLLAVPGLDLNHQHRFVAYRVALPILSGQSVNADVVRACFRIAVKSGMDLVPTLRSIVSGELQPEGVLEDAAREMMDAVLPAAAPPPPPAAAPPTPPAVAAMSAPPVANTSGFGTSEIPDKFGNT